MYKCALCGQEMKAISWKHLHFKHGLTVAEYKAMGYETGIGAKLKGRPNLALKGRKFPERSEMDCYKTCIGKEPWNKGKTGVYTDEQRRRISEGTKRNTPRGPDSPAWKGGITKKSSEWRKAVLQRDNYTCQLCGRKTTGRWLHTHHIKPKSEYPELEYDVDNGITLCSSHHATVHFRPGFDLIAELDKRQGQF